MQLEVCRLQFYIFGVFVEIPLKHKEMFFQKTNKLIRSVFIIGSLSATETNFWNFRTCDNDLWSNDEGKRKHPLVLSDNRKGGQGGQGG